ncbi:DUF4232 domain-containing protein [Streptomyces albidus (ex Kaewkla and Franco 2022)]|uniref:DUF4232 domain-containing protein n=1 Tax=Streptomyces albidus (ex Kaewkla and Franco 2022) TaxID=722709 RepID=UPI0015EF5FC1|nr:DUF4232 domain-containing protein [Streptomyces albidus (ex Kaewkla and Franco 2022)]
MRLRTNYIAAALVPLALFAVTACNGVESGASKSQGDSSSAGSSQGSGDSGKGADGASGSAGTGGGSAKEKTTSGPDTGDNDGDGTGNTATEACSEDNASMKIGEEESDGVSYMLFVKNEGSAPCNIAPIPTVDAVNGETGDITAPLNDGQRDKGVGADVTTLKPNYTASTNFTYDSSKCQGESDTGATSISVTASKNSIFTLKVPGGRSAFICGGPLTVSSWTLPKYQ